MSATVDYIERSIQAYRLDTNITLEEILNIVNFIENIRKSNPENVLFNVIGSPGQYLYLADNGIIMYKNYKIIWLKFGWARKSGLPEIINAETGKMEVLRLSGKVYLFEPSHFLLFNHDSNIILLYEYNLFAPRPSRLCEYLRFYYKNLNKLEENNVKIYARRIFTKDVEKLLRGYSIVKGLRLELEVSSAEILARKLGESESLLESLFSKFGSNIVSISWRSSRGKSLEITIEKILELFYDLENWTNSFVVTVKKEHIGRSERIDLKKNSLTFRKKIRLATENGQTLRSTDTGDAINVLISTIDDVISQL